MVLGYRGRGREFGGEKVIGSKRVGSGRGGEGGVGRWVGLTGFLRVRGEFESKSPSIIVGVSK